MKNKHSQAKQTVILFSIFLAFILISMAVNFEFGIRIGNNFFLFAWDMMKILPPAFILIGLFNVWVKNETIEKNFGHTSGFKKYIWAILLAATTAGGTFVSFPIAHSLNKKGAKYSAIFAYVTASSLVMVPMTVMEASILGPKFTLIRLGISLPLVVISSILLGSYFEGIGYVLPEEEEDYEVL